MPTKQIRNFMRKRNVKLSRRLNVTTLNLRLNYGILTLKKKGISAKSCSWSASPKKYEKLGVSEKDTKKTQIRKFLMLHFPRYCKHLPQIVKTLLFINTSLNFYRNPPNSKMRENQISLKFFNV